MGGIYFRPLKAPSKTALDSPEEAPVPTDSELPTLLEPSSSAVTFPPFDGGKQRRERKAAVHSAPLPSRKWHPFGAAVLSKLNK